MNAEKALSDSFGLVMALINDIEKAASAGKALEAVLADPAVSASLAALASDIIG